MSKIEELVYGKSWCEGINMQDYEKTKDQLIKELIDLREENRVLKKEIQSYKSIVADSSHSFTPTNPVKNIQSSFFTNPSDFKKAHYEAIKYKEKIEEIVESVSDAFFRLDSQWRYIYINKGAEVLKNIHKDLVGQVFWEASPHFNDSIIYDEFHRAVEEKEPVIFEYYSNSSNKYLEFRCYPSQEGLSVIVINISDRYEAKQKVKLNEIRLETLVKLNQMTDVTIKEIVDFTFKQAIELTGSEIGWIGFMNEDETKVTIYSYSQNVMEDSKISGEGIALSTENSGIWGEAIRQRRPFLMNDYLAPNPLKRGYPDGHMPIKRFLVLPIFDDKKIVITVAVANKREEYDESDINQLTLLVSGIWRIIQRKKAEERLCQLESHFSNIFKLSPVAMSIINGADGSFSDVNDAFVNITGYTKNEVIGKHWTEFGLFQKADIEKIRKKFYKHSSYYNLETNFFTKSGERAYGLSSYEHIDLSGKKCILFATLDITEKRKYEKELARLDRFNLIGEMAAGIGHEVRNPMTTVRGFLQLLFNKEDYSKHREYFSLMIQELDRANSIITSFLSLAKNKSVNLKVQNLNSIIANIYPLIEADAIVSDNYINMELNEVPDLPLDEKEIHQLILNLVRNGIEAMSPGGKITIKTYVDGKDIILAVSDEGHGIAPTLVDKIDTPFFTTKDNGTGLGLPVCYSIASRQNAKIDIETDSAGTTFFVRFLRRRSKKDKKE